MCIFHKWYWYGKKLRVCKKCGEVNHYGSQYPGDWDNWNWVDPCELPEYIKSWRKEAIECDKRKTQQDKFRKKIIQSFKVI